MKEWAEKYISREYVYSYGLDPAELISILCTSCKKDGFTEHDGFRIQINGNRFRLRDATGHRPGYYVGLRAFYGKIVPIEIGCLVQGRFEPCPRSAYIPVDMIFTASTIIFGFSCHDLISWIWVILLLVFIYSPYAKQNGESENSVLQLLSSIAHKS